MTIKDALTKAINILKKSNIENPIQQAKIVLASVLQKSKEYILINENEILSNEIYKDFIKKIKSVAEGVPLQYITHIQEFMGMDFYVDENVLIPQPDTEILVEDVLSIIGEQENLSLLDMCTGSGAIAVSIAKNTNNCKIYAVDISITALEVAKKNAIKNGVDKKIEFINSNMFEKLDINKKFDIIVSNPPYIETDTIKQLDIQVQNEPKIALDGGIDGLDFYKNILANSRKYLKENGTIAMEIGYNQRKAVTDLFKTQYENVYCKKDLSGKDRVIVCKNQINIL